MRKAFNINTCRGKFPPPVNASIKSMMETGTQHNIKPKVANIIVHVARISRAFLDWLLAGCGLPSICATSRLLDRIANKHFV